MLIHLKLWQLALRVWNKKTNKKCLDSYSTNTQVFKVRV